MVNRFTGSPVRDPRFAASSLTGSPIQQGGLNRFLLKVAGSNLYCEPVPPVRRFDLLWAIGNSNTIAIPYNITAAEAVDREFNRQYNRQYNNKIG